MKRIAQVVMVATLVGCGAACSADEGTSVPSSAPSSSATSPGLSDDEVTARIVAGVPPKDVVWKNPQAPEGSTRLSTQKGNAQWRVGDTACIVGISQPAGLGSGESPTDAEIADRQVQQIGQAIGASSNLDVSEGSLMVPARVVGSAAEVKQKFVERSFRSGDSAEGVVRAHRFGDFALIAYAACGKDDFEQASSSSIEGFLDSLAVVLTF